MSNCMWRDTLLQVSDLPEKARRFIDLMNIDLDGLEIIHLVGDPNGSYFKAFVDSGRNPNGVYVKCDNMIYFIGRLRVGIIIHELTHFYLDRNKYDTKSISENYINKYGVEALTTYACKNMLEAKGSIPLSGFRVNWDTLPESVYKKNMESRWDEVVCEIVATYGRRGQFDKIKELFEVK